MSVPMRSHLLSNNSKNFATQDVVYTPATIAKEIIDRYKPNGRVLDPCMGDGAFFQQIPDCMWCEISKGRDFFTWKSHVDWIIGNPPFSVLNQWLSHSFEVADNVVYLLPIAKVFGSRKRLLMIYEYGGIVDIYAPWTGRAVGFEFGWACGAIYIKRGHGTNMSLVVE